MKKALIYVLITIIACNAQILHANDDCLLYENFSDSIWIQWFADSLDTNVEILEMRNEYMFCRLASKNNTEFVSFLSNCMNETNSSKIAKELQNPVNDDIDVRKCIRKVKRSKGNRQFKRWLIQQLGKKRKLSVD